METIQTILLVVQVLVAISLIGLILIQHGKGADAGAAFGSGASSTVFGAAGSGNFLSRTTAVLAAIFLANSLGLAWIASQRVQTSGSLMDQPVTEVQSAPVQPASPVDDIPADPASTPISEVPTDPIMTPESGTEQLAESASADVTTASEVPVEVPVTEPAIETPAMPEVQMDPLPAVEIEVPDAVPASE